MTPKKDKQADKKIRIEAYKKLGLILVGIILLVNTIQLARFGEIVERVDMYNRGVVDELGGIRQDVVSFAGDLNEIREFLLLPVRRYSFFEDKELAPDHQEEKNANRAVSTVYALLTGIKNAQLAEATMNALIKDQNFIASLKQDALTIGPLENNESALLFKIKNASDNAIFAFIIDRKSNTAKIQSVLGTYQVKATQVKATVTESLKNEIVQYFKDHAQKVAEIKSLIEKQQADISALPKNENIAKIFQEKNMTLITNHEDTDEALLYHLKNSEKDKLLTIAIQRGDGSISFEDKNYKTWEDFLAAFIESIQNVDATTYREKLVNASRAELEAVFNETAFQDLLKDSGLTLATTPRAEYSKLLYDLKDADDKTVFSFAIELSSGYYKLLKDGQEIDLLSTLGSGSKKKS